MVIVPGDKPPLPPSEAGGKGGLGQRIWAKMLGMSPEEYLRQKSNIPHPTTTDELNSASIRRYGQYFAGLLHDGEELRGIPAFKLTENVPRPPAELIHGEARLPLVGRMYENHKYHDSERYRFKLAGHGGTWMGGDWDSDAGKFAIAAGGWGVRPRSIANYLVFTSFRVLLASDRYPIAEKPGTFIPPRLQMEYRAGDIAIRPGWPGTSKGYIYRVDLAFSDGSWIGIQGTSQGHCSIYTGRYPSLLYRDLIAELLGFPVPPRTSQRQATVDEPT
jgi:hypothetical protein